MISMIKHQPELVRSFSVGKAIMFMVFFFYSCEELQTENSDGIAGGVVINEINYNSSDSYDPDDWIEIYNRSNNAIDMGSWVLKDENDEHLFIIPSNTVLSPDQYLVFCKDTTKFTALFPDLSPYYGDLGFGLGGGSDDVRLFDSNGLLVDIVEYDDESPWPILADGNGPTLELNNPSLDNTMGENWSASEDYGTPGAVNSVYTDAE
jgi:hypothetical protein